MWTVDDTRMLIMVVVCALLMWPLMLLSRSFNGGSCAPKKGRRDA